MRAYEVAYKVAHSKIVYTRKLLVSDRETIVHAICRVGKAKEKNVKLIDDKVHEIPFSELELTKMKSSDLDIFMSEFDPVVIREKMDRDEVI